MHTIAVIMSDTQLVWTQPQDAVYSPKAKPPGLSDDRLVALTSGEIVRIPDVTDKEIHMLMTRAGGEIIPIPRPKPISNARVKIAKRSELLPGLRAYLAVETIRGTSGRSVTPHY